MTTPDLRERREAIVQAHIAAENAGDAVGTRATFHYPRYDVVPMGAIVDGAAAVEGFVG